MKKRDDFDRRLKEKFRFAVILTACIFFMELFGGFWTNSLALLSDSAHVFMDFFALGLSWFALYISAFPPSDTRTYGWHRSEVFASFINGISLFVVAGVIFYEAYERIFSPPHVKSMGLLVVATIGLIANIIVAVKLKEYSHDDLNIKSAFYHVLGDAVASVGVIIGGVIIYFTGLFVVDPIISVFIGLILLVGATKITLESSHILLEGVPKGTDINKVAETIKAVEGVSGLHSLHVWSICSNLYALSAHVEIEDDARNNQKSILTKIEKELTHGFHISHTTLQIECEECKGDDLIKPMNHSHKGHQAGHNH
ncbi:MAG: cation diffusion facilitator family transporter [Thermodesulfobacteriota bacterium]